MSDPTEGRFSQAALQAKIEELTAKLRQIGVTKGPSGMCACDPQFSPDAVTCVMRGESQECPCVCHDSHVAYLTGRIEELTAKLEARDEALRVLAHEQRALRESERQSAKYVAQLRAKLEAAEAEKERLTAVIFQRDNLSASLDTMRGQRNEALARVSVLEKALREIAAPKGMKIIDNGAAAMLAYCVHTATEALEALAEQRTDQEQERPRWGLSGNLKLLPEDEQPHD